MFIEVRRIECFDINQRDNTTAEVMMFYMVDLLGGIYKMDGLDHRHGPTGGPSCQPVYIYCFLRHLGGPAFKNIYV